MVLRGSNFNTEGLGLKICNISEVENNISMETLKVGFHFPPHLWLEESFAEEHVIY